jgi:hypothetical protein
MMDIERMALDNDYLNFRFQMELRARLAALLTLLLLVLGASLLSFFPQILFVPQTTIGQFGVIGGMAIPVLALATNFIFSISEARALSYKLRAAFGLRWRLHKAPWAEKFDLLAAEDAKKK